MLMVPQSYKDSNQDSYIDIYGLVTKQVINDFLHVYNQFSYPCLKFFNDSVTKPTNLKEVVKALSEGATRLNVQIKLVEL